MKIVVKSAQKVSFWSWRQCSKIVTIVLKSALVCFIQFLPSIYKFEVVGIWVGWNCVSSLNHIIMVEETKFLWLTLWTIKHIGCWWTHIWLWNQYSFYSSNSIMPDGWSYVLCEDIMIGIFRCRDIQTIHKCMKFMCSNQ